MRDMPPLPPLPASWPFPARSVSTATHLQEGCAVPGQGEGWSVEAPGPPPFGDRFEPLGGAFGRGGVGRAGEVVIRPYRRGGWVRRMNDRTYLSAERFRRELQIHLHLWQAGFPTVEPLGCAWRRHRWGVEGLYLTRFVEGEPWPRSWDPGCWPEVTRGIEALSAWGCWSPDLNATNVHRASTGETLLLDFDRACFPEARGLRSRYFDRLLRSLEKLNAPGPLREAAAKDRG